MQTKAIALESNPSQEHLNRLGVFNWSIWTKEVSEFPWSEQQNGIKRG